MSTLASLRMSISGRGSARMVSFDVDLAADVRVLRVRRGSRSSMFMVSCQRNWLAARVPG